MHEILPTAEDQRLRRAVKKAVDLHILSQPANADEYLDYHNWMKEILAAADSVSTK